MLTRQLVTKKKYVLWTVFGGQPLRFSLVEFGAITGLPCGEFGEGYDHEYQLPVGDASYEYWEKLIGPDRQTTLGDIAEMLRDNPNMPSWRRIRLALILIVDGVLISSTQVHKPTLKYVKLVENLEAFMAFPWGRESFSWTLSSMKPGKKVMGKCENPVGTYRDQLQQTSFRLVGFPLVLQLLALEAIPVLLGKVGKALEGITLLEFLDDKLPKSSAVTLTQVLDAEDDPKLVVKPTMDYKNPKTDGWCDWDDEIKDRKVDYMEKLISCSHVFKKSDWPGGDASLPFTRRKRKAADVSRKKNVVESKEEDSSSEYREKKRNGKRVGVDKKKSGIKKQRGLNGYFVKGVEVEEKLDLLIGRVEELTRELRKVNERLDKAEKWGKRRKLGRVGKFSSQKRGSSRRRRSQKPMLEVGRIKSEGLSNDGALTLISLKGNDRVSSQWIERMEWKNDSGKKIVDGNESGDKHLRTKVDRVEDAKITSGGEGGVENEITSSLLNEGKVGTSEPGVEEEMKDEEVNISDGQEAVDERGTNGDAMEEGENEILSSLVLIGEGGAKKKVCEQRKTAEELPIVAHATEPASVLPQVEPTQKKEESPNGSARGIVILFLKFSSKESMPSRDELTSTFSAFGSLDSSKTHVSEESSSAQVAFMSTGDAIEALKGLEKASPFGETLVSFKLQPKVISVQRTKAPVISGFCPVLKLINTPMSVDSMKQNLLLMTEMLEKSGDRVPRETKEELKSDITGLLEMVSSMRSSSSSYV